MDKELKWVFYGTDEFSIGVLDELKAKNLLPALIITAPDKPKGRHLTLTPPPVKLWAEQNGISLIQPIKLRELDSNSSSTIGNSSFALVASYGKIIPQIVLDLPQHGTLNIHPSLLPKFRGATPLESAILSGDTQTGVTIIKLDAEMDHGPIIAQQELDISDLPYYEELRDRLAKLGADLLAQNIDNYLAGKLEPAEQDHTQATFTPKIEKTAGQIDLEGNPEENYRKIRALTPWPGTYFFIKRNSKDFRVLIKKAYLEDDPSSSAGKALKIDRVLPEGKKEISWTEFETNYLK